MKVYKKIDRRGMFKGFTGSLHLIVGNQEQYMSKTTKDLVFDMVFAINSSGSIMSIQILHQDETYRRCKSIKNVRRNKGEIALQKKEGDECIHIVSDNSPQINNEGYFFLRGTYKVRDNNISTIYASRQESNKIPCLEIFQLLCSMWKDPVCAVTSASNEAIALMEKELEHVGITGYTIHEVSIMATTLKDYEDL